MLGVGSSVALVTLLTLSSWKLPSSTSRRGGSESQGVEMEAEVVASHVFNGECYGFFKLEEGGSLYYSVSLLLGVWILQLDVCGQIAQVHDAPNI